VEAPRLVFLPLNLAGGLAMTMRNWPIVLLSLALYGVGLYGVWQLMSDGRFHWPVAAFPVALLVLSFVPFLVREPKQVTHPEVFLEDRTE